jgi:hypothetical protein
VPSVLILKQPKMGFVLLRFEQIVRVIPIFIVFYYIMFTAGVWSLPKKNATSAIIRLTIDVENKWTNIRYYFCEKLPLPPVMVVHAIALNFL